MNLDAVCASGLRRFHKPDRRFSHNTAAERYHRKLHRIPAVVPFRDRVQRNQTPSTVGTIPSTAAASHASPPAP